MHASFACLFSALDIRPLAQAIDAKPELWNEITARQTTPGSPHSDTRAIFLRWSKDLSVHAVFNDIEAVDYPALKALDVARKYIAMTIGHVRGTKLGRVMIVSLKPGGRITPHVDEGAYADHYERFHLVIKSKPGNFFCVGNAPHYQTAEMSEGELWWFNHKEQHWVVNNSNEERIHMILDVVAPHYRQERVA